MVNARLEDAAPEQVIAWAANAGNLAMMSSFGTQAVVLLHMATQVKPDIPVVMVDTGFLLPETYEYVEELTSMLGLNLTIASPSMSAARMEAVYGKLWESDEDADHKLYGKLTKTEPMARGLASLDVAPELMLSGLRAGQTETRKNMQRVTQQPDGTFKVLPLLQMSDDDVDEYLSHHKLPAHPLVSKGYVTVGDWHSSRPLAEGETREDARSTRFGGRFQECGLHVTDDAEVDAMQGRDAMAAFAEARLELTREKSERVLSSTESAEGSCFVSHLVKKRLEDGSMCKKCNDVSAKLKADGLEDLVGGISIAETTDKESDGVALAEHFEQEKAPFFLVKDSCDVNAEWKPIYAYGKWKKLVQQKQ